MADAIPKERPNWLKSIENKLDGNTTKLSELVDSINFVTLTVTELKKEIAEVNQENDSLRESYHCLQKENYELRSEIKEIKRTLEYQELQSRRNNLIVYGIPENMLKEESWSESEKLIIEHLSRCFGGLLTSQEIERAHRLGKRLQGGRKPRPIIVKFTRFKTKEKIWSQRSKLAGSKLIVLEDFPAQIRENRRKLTPYFLAARNCEAVKTVKLSLDNLIIDGKVYTVQNIESIPVSPGPGGISTKETSDVLVFSSSKTVFSNLYPCNLTIEGIDYNSTEQRIQAMKAKLFYDDDTHDRIMNETDTYKIMQLGKTVQNFSKTIWNDKAEEITFAANAAKYAQINSAAEALINTGQKKLGESTMHPLFGTGHKLTSKDATNPAAWKAKNLMGKILEKVRRELQENERH